MKKLVMSSAMLIVLLMATVASASLVFADEPADGAQENHKGYTAETADRWAIKFAVAAEVLDMTVEEIEAEVQAGKYLPQIAAEQGVDVQTLRDAVHGAMNEAGYSCGSH
jgi:hypothetical protein